MDIDYLSKRFQSSYLQKRLELQIYHSAYRLSSKKIFSIYIENIDWIYLVLKWLLQAVGLLERGRSNSIRYQITEQSISFSNLPLAFDQYKILHLSDLHIDGIFDNCKKLFEILDTLTYDLCVITGDYRFHTFGDYDLVIKRMQALRKHLKTDVYCILGNHDFIEFVPLLEQVGYKCLVNERVKLQCNEDFVFLLGSDDMHFYDSQNFELLYQDLSDEDFKILLLHSPEGIEEAVNHGTDLYLCGHSHGGQVCLPGEIAILSNSSAKRKFNKGFWESGKMKGYTSKGVGSSGLDVRFFCPPEIVIHTLVKG